MRNYPFRIALIYFIMASAWIFSSDQVAEWLTPLRYLTLVQSIKGFAFVVISAIVIFLLTRRYYREMQRNEYKYRKLFRDNPHPMFIFDTTTLKFLAVNQAALAKYKYRQEEFLKMDVTDIRPAQERESIIEYLKNTDDRSFNESGIWTHMDKFGDKFYVRVFSHSTTFENKKARVVLAVDIDEAVQAEQRMQISERKLNGLINNTDDLIWMIDREGILVAINEPFKKKFKDATGIDLEVNSRIDVAKLPAAWLIDNWRNHIIAAFNGQKIRIEQQIETLGRQEYYEIILNPIYSNTGEVFNVGCFARDITHRKESENRIRGQMQKLKEVAWIQSHEVRRPLANILGLINIFKQNSETRQNDELLHYLETSSRELDAVVKKVVDASTGDDSTEH